MSHRQHIDREPIPTHAEVKAAMLAGDPDFCFFGRTDVLPAVDHKDSFCLGDRDPDCSPELSEFAHQRYQNATSLGVTVMRRIREYRRDRQLDELYLSRRGSETFDGPYVITEAEEAITQSEQAAESTEVTITRSKRS